MINTKMSRASSYGMATTSVGHKSTTFFQISKIFSTFFKKNLENNDKKIELPDDDWVVFIPDEAMRAFRHAKYITYKDFQNDFTY